MEKRSPGIPPNFFFLNLCRRSVFLERNRVFFEKNFSTLLTTSDDFSIIIEDIRFTCKLNQQL